MIIEEIMAGERGEKKGPVKNGKGPVKGIHKQHLLVYLNIQNHGSEEVHSSWEICTCYRSYVFFHLFQW